MNDSCLSALALVAEAGVNAQDGLVIVIECRILKMYCMRLQLQVQAFGDVIIYKHAASEFIHLLVGLAVIKIISKAKGRNAVLESSYRVDKDPAGNNPVYGSCCR